MSLPNDEIIYSFSLYSHLTMMYLGTDFIVYIMCEVHWPSWLQHAQVKIFSLNLEILRHYLFKYSLYPILVLITFWELHFTVYTYISLYIFTYAQVYNNLAITLSSIYSSFPLGKCILIFLIFRSWKCFVKLSSSKNRINHNFNSQKWTQQKKKKVKNNNK